MSPDAAKFLLPEILLIAVAVAIYVVGAFVEAPRAWRWVAGGGVLLASAALWLLSPAEVQGRQVMSDWLACYGRWLALACGGLMVLLASRPLAGHGTPEYLGSLLLTVAGLMLATSAGDLVLLFVSLELISIPTYILLYLGRRDAQSQESAAKYFFLSVLASAMLLYGLSFLYGTAGSTDLHAIQAALGPTQGASAGLGGLAKVAAVLIFAGLGFRIAAVPFHFYAPDVYQGTTHANAALLSVLPKAAGLVVLVRLVVAAVPSGEAFAWRIAVALSLLTMTLGNLLALWQDNLRRLMAYSSIAHAGYILIALAVALAGEGAADRGAAVGAMLFYLAVYAAATIGVFAALDYLGGKEHELTAVEELAGLRQTRPLVAALLAVFMFSLTGIPPLAGFQGKLLVFFNALSVDGEAAGGARAWFVALAIVGALNAAVSAGYYLRIVAVMCFRTPLATPKAQGGRAAWLCAVACAALTVFLGVLPGPLLRQAERAGQPGVTGLSAQGQGTIASGSTSFPR